jgi:hypothetical protein
MELELASMTLPGVYAQAGTSMTRTGWESCCSDRVPGVAFLRHHKQSGDGRLREVCVVIAWPGSYVLS